MFSTDLTLTLDAAYREAETRRHQFFCVEHLLFALMFDEKVKRIVRDCGGNSKELKEELENFLTHEMEQVPYESGQNADTDGAPPLQTPALQRVLQRSILHMHSSGRQEITSGEVLAQIFTEKESHAAYFLENQGVTRLKVLEWLSHGGRNDERELALNEAGEESDDGDYTDSQTTAPQKLVEDLTALAEAGALDPVIGREKELERIVQILARRRKNNPLILGDPGVGKTALAHALADRIIQKKVPEVLQNAKLFSLQVSDLIAGTKFRGEFEDRMKRLLNQLEKHENAILFIDEIHTIVGAGATGNGTMDVANILKPALTSGKLHCIGSTTHEDYKKSIEKDRALSRRFSTVSLNEPTAAEAIEILSGLKSRLEEHHKVSFLPSALKAAVDLSAKHIHDRFLPDKAIDVLDESGAKNAVSKEPKARIGKEEIEQTISLMTGVPLQAVSQQEERNLLDLEAQLGSIVFGQELAVSAVSRAIKRSRANLKDDRKPLGSFLFAGPTGVGKTELARALSTTLGVPFHRFDMSEYMEKHAVARLIGAPPGYVGYEEGGLLTDLIRKQPYSVLLLDEIEKAHPDIFNILLQIMDDASLTDAQGRKANFQNAIIILTTNAGSEKSGSIGFGERGVTVASEQELKRLFKPEFRNRLDETIHFQPLPHEVILSIVKKFISLLEEQLSDKKVSLELTDGALEWLAERGFDSLLGARPMRRLIEREIKDVLADELLFGKLKSGGTAKIDVKGDGLLFSFGDGAK